MNDSNVPTAFDIIICGGGTSGCVLAARLSEDPSLQVLLLEAGEDANSDPRVLTPGLAAMVIDNPERDWGYVSEPNPGMNGRCVSYTRGKCIGGSSASNLMALIYPSKTGLDTWAELGNPGWDWQNMAPYFRKSTAFLPAPKEVETALGIDYIGEFTGANGPIKASFPQALRPLDQIWINTWKNLNRFGKSPVDGIGHGGFITPAAIDTKTGQRSFAGTEYYKPASARCNLHTVTKALVRRVQTQREPDDVVRATGVEYIVDGQIFTATARREVILSAGVIGSPQILELSGIGAADTCRSFGIESVIDNGNVGENLLDHLAGNISHEVKDDVQTLEMMRDPVVAQAAMQQYAATHDGPLATGSHTFSYTPLIDSIYPESKQDLEALLEMYEPPVDLPNQTLESLRYEFIRKIILSPDETSAVLVLSPSQCQASKGPKITDMLAPTEPGGYISLFVQLSHPFSRGSVHIQSASPDDAPRISPNYLSHPLDLEIFARHLMQCEVLLQTEPLKSILKPGGRRLQGGLHAKTLGAAKELARAESTSFYHPCGTCAMLPLELGGVVNERLIVHGTSNLRVIDASIFPIEPRGNIQTTVYAVAEKGADLIKEDLLRTTAKDV